MRPAALLLLTLLASASVANAGPSTTPKPGAKSAATAKAAKLAGVAKLKLKPQPQPTAPSAYVFEDDTVASHPPFEISSVDKVRVSPQRPLDNGASMTAVKARVVTAQVGAWPRGVHLSKEGEFSVNVPRAWVGSRDLLVECTGGLPTSVTGAAVLMHDTGSSHHGEIVVAPIDDKVRFLLMTAELGAGNWVSVKIINTDFQSGANWRVDGCSVERL